MKNPLLIAALMLASALLAGCGSSDSGEDTATSGSPKAKADPNQPPSSENAGGAKPESAL